MTNVTFIYISLGKVNHMAIPNVHALSLQNCPYHNHWDPWLHWITLARGLMLQTEIIVAHQLTVELSWMSSLNSVWSQRTFQVEGERESDKEMCLRIGEGDAILLALKLGQGSIHQGMWIPFRFRKKKTLKEMVLPAMVWVSVPPKSLGWK